MSPLTEEETNSFIEKIGEIFDVPLFTKTDANRLLTLAKESVQWETKIKQQLTKARLPHSIDQIPLLPCNPATNDSILPLQALAPLFSLHDLDVGKENLTNLLNKLISASKNPLSKDCMNYTAPFPRDFYILDEVKTIRPEYLIGTWFNRQKKAFKVNMELDWVNRVDGINCILPVTPMSISLFASTGDHIWDFISEVHVHRTAMMEFGRARDGWIEAPTVGIWKHEAADAPLNFVERMFKVTGGKTIVQLKSGKGGWATFERVRAADVTAAAARLLFRFDDPLYCARSDGKVVIKLKDLASRATLRDTNNFPSGRTLVNNKNKFPSCIP